MLYTTNGVTMSRTAELAYEAVREGIVTGTHAAGSRLREEQLAGDLGVSRTPVREALHRLHSEGLVDMQPNRGALVATWEPDDLDDIFELRALVEGYGARRAATRVGSAELTELVRLCDEMDEAVTATRAGGSGPVERPDGASASAHDRITELNLAFHRAVHVAARSRRLVVALGGLVQVPLVHHTFHRYTTSDLARSVGHHHELVDALRSANGGWAESIMRSHVRAARESLRRVGASAADEDRASASSDEPRLVKT